VTDNSHIAQLTAGKWFDTVVVNTVEKKRKEQNRIEQNSTQWNRTEQKPVQGTAVSC